MTLVAWTASVGIVVSRCGCQRGCARDGRAEGSLAVPSLAAPGSPLNAVDCPDGLARCEQGTVAFSKLGSVPAPCRGPASACACPWQPAGDCPNGCVSEGVELVAAPAIALIQLCAPEKNAPPVAVPVAEAPALSIDGGNSLCDEGDRFRCAGGSVVDCASGRAVGRCLRGCFAEDTSIEDDAVTREGAFAILCSR